MRILHYGTLVLSGGVFIFFASAIHAAVRLPVPGAIERRGEKRRSRYERRLRAEIVLAPGIERCRHVTVDCRQDEHCDHR